MLQPPLACRRCAHTSVAVLTMCSTHGAWPTGRDELRRGGRNVGEDRAGAGTAPLHVGVRLNLRSRRRAHLGRGAREYKQILF